MENFNSQSIQFDLSFKKYIKQSAVSIFSKDNICKIIFEKNIQMEINILEQKVII